MKNLWKSGLIGFIFTVREVRDKFQASCLYRDNIGRIQRVERSEPCEPVSYEYRSGGEGI